MVGCSCCHFSGRPGRRSGGQGRPSDCPAQGGALTNWPEGTFRPTRLGSSCLEPRCNIRRQMTSPEGARFDPAVLTHRVNGRKSLYGNPATRSVSTGCLNERARNCLTPWTIQIAMETADPTSQDWCADARPLRTRSYKALKFPSTVSDLASSAWVSCVSEPRPEGGYETRQMLPAPRPFPL